ncbi:hypothetical protein AB0A81_36795 [Streptomyces flaveolus]|uniref:Uncharacterized protein n=1 Tax=Streptomyces flaveolus TaxID=67297 RepID=A0ABV1VRD4_9ACTN
MRADFLAHLRPGVRTPLHATVIDDGVVKVAEAWHAMLRADLEELFDDGERDSLNAAIEGLPPFIRWMFGWRAKPCGCATCFDTFLQAARYEITPELATQIATTGDQEAISPASPSACST